MRLNILLFDDFETLDAFGPAEIFGKLPEHYQLECYSLKGGTVTSSQNLRTHTLPSSQVVPGGILLVPGGMGTRALVEDPAFLSELARLAADSTCVLSVCTGSGLLARAGLLDGKRATSNKRAFGWAAAQGDAVLWQKRARWVRDGNLYTSSGISAGMDMALGFVADFQGEEVARDLAERIEYLWNWDREEDPFALP